MARREGPAASKKPTARQVAAGKANLAKGRESKKAKAAESAAIGREQAKERWAKLLDGTLTVRDLDDEEVKRMQVRNVDGCFGGKKPLIPSHLAQQFQAEMLRRANAMFKENAQTAIQVLVDIAMSGDAREGDRVRAAQYIVDRALGKTPETVHVKHDDPWSDMISEALDEDRSLMDEERP